MKRPEVQEVAVKVLSSFLLSGLAGRRHYIVLRGYSELDSGGCHTFPAKGPWKVLSVPGFSSVKWTH